MDGQNKLEWKAEFEMELKYDPIAYIRKNGNPYHKLELSLILGYRDKEVLSLLDKTEALQNPDGSWPWRWKQDNPGGIIETAKVISLLSKLQVKKIAKAISFIHSLQREDGGWSENLELSTFIPEEWTFWRTDCSSPYFTGEALCALIHSGCKENLAAKKTLN